MDQCIVGVTRHGWAAQCIVYVRNALSVRMNIETSNSSSWYS